MTVARNADQNSSPQMFHHGNGYLTHYYFLNKESHKSKCLLNILVGAVGSRVTAKQGQLSYRFQITTTF